MKKLLKLLGVVLVATFVLATVSCGEEEIIKKGGTIEVTNKLANNAIAYVIIAKGSDYQKALEDLNEGKGKVINPGATESFKFDEDGIYTVCALAVPALVQPVPQPVTLALGSTKKVIIQ